MHSKLESELLPPFFGEIIGDFNARKVVKFWFLPVFYGDKSEIQKTLVF